jgi:Rieske Fe-S protein
MSAQGVNKTRRRVLVAATSVVGAVGAGFALVPFIDSMNPSAKARAAGAPVEADISQLEPGGMLRLKWRGKPVWVVNRTPEMLEALPTLDPELVDPASEAPQQPDYCQNATRSVKEQYFVVSASARIWAARRPSGRSFRRRIWVEAGAAGSSVPATDPSSISRAVFTRVSRRPRIW